MQNKPGMPRYMQDHETAMGMPKPTDSNEFMTWLFQSNILTEHQKDLIRARFMAPPAMSAGPTQSV